jgi:predicted nucleotidyltransferase component of viral defense system
MSLKTHIRNLAKEKRISALVLLQNYMFEGFLMRLSRSEYRDKFILKGGMLIAAMVGLDNRSTMDLDATLKDLPLTEDAIRLAITSICSISVGDDISYSVSSIEVIRPDDVYGGYRVKLEATFDTVSVPLSVDISTGDVITPAPVRYTFRGIFDDENEIELWAYNTETIIAEKLETVLRRNTLNTRARDFYDIVVFASRQSHDHKF